jgi:hypothetical protein
MELIQAIALLCQIGYGGISVETPIKEQLNCHQSYLNCVSKRRGTMTEKEALEKCILEK